jgi:TetR/AcrR family transcriptional regulator, fatty acid metabolism regulator protein
MPEHEREEAGEGGDDRAATTRKRRRRQILDAATEVFAERGYHKASISDVIDRAGIARGTFYLYFSSKHSVFAAILDEALTELRSRVSPVEVGPDARPPREQLLDQVVAVVGYLLDNRALTQLVLSPGLSPADDVVERLEAFNAHVLDLLSASLGHGIAMGLLRECDTELVAAAILGALRGIIAHLLAVDELPDLAQVADELLQFALSGVVRT